MKKGLLIISLFAFSIILISMVRADNFGYNYLDNAEVNVTGSTGALDGNASSICSGGEVLFGNGSCGVVGSGATSDIYVNESGDTMTGDLTLGNNKLNLSQFYIQEDAFGHVFKIVKGSIQAIGIVETGGVFSLNLAGNMTANYYMGDGSYLTNLPASNLNDSYHADEQIKEIQVDNGSLTWKLPAGDDFIVDLVNATGGAFIVKDKANTFMHVFTSMGSMVMQTGWWAPLADNTYDLGSGGGIPYGSVLRWRNLYLAGSIIGSASPQALNLNASGDIDAANIYLQENVTESPVVFMEYATGNISTSGNISADYYYGSGLHLTDISGGSADGDKLSVTYVVGASNSINTTRADYVCDGNEDEVEIMYALKNASVLGLGGRVVLLEGDYTINNTIDIPQNDLTLQGQGKGTRLVSAGDLTTLDTNGTDNTRIKDIYIKGSGSEANPNGCFEITGTTKDIIVEGVIVEDCGWKGIYSTTTNVEYGVISNSQAIDSGDDGFSIKASGMRLINNMARDNSGDGFFIDSMMRSVLTGNVAKDNAHHGFYLLNAQVTLATGNLAFVNDKTGFYFDRCDDSEITGNNAWRNENHGIYVRGENMVVIGNLVRENDYSDSGNYDGIYAYNFVFGVVSNNVVTGSDRYELNLDSTTKNNSIIGNFVNSPLTHTGDINDAGTDNYFSGNYDDEGTFYQGLGYGSIFHSDSANNMFVEHNFTATGSTFFEDNVRVGASTGEVITMDGDDLYLTGTCEIGDGLLVGIYDAYGYVSIKTQDTSEALNINGSINSLNDCGIPSAVFWAEENGGLDNAQYEWSFGNGATQDDLGILQVCPGVVTAMSVQCDVCTGSTSTVQVRINNTGTACQTDIDTTHSAGGKYGMDISCSNAFAQGDFLQFYTSDDAGTCQYCVATMWVRYD